MLAFKIRNLRALKDTGRIRLRRVNLLVGLNSSGKSTLLRAFPLLRQSIETSTRGPILWHGNYVDFGSFDAAVRNRNPKYSIGFDFELPFRIPRSGALRRARAEYGANLGTARTTCHVSLNVSRVQETNHSYVSALQLRISAQDGAGQATKSDGWDRNTDTAHIVATEDGAITCLRVNDYDVTLDRPIYLQSGLSLLPFPTTSEAGNTPAPRPLRLRRLSDTSFWELVSKRIYEHFRTITDAAVAETTLHHNTVSMWYAPPPYFLEYINLVLDQSHLPPGALDALRGERREQIESGFWTRLRELLLLRALPEIIEGIDIELERFFRGVRYKTPARATAERFYRSTDVAVDELAPDGSNMAEFLESLNTEERRLFKDWTIKAFGFHVETSRSLGHISVQIRESDQKTLYNLADVGFGYSQLLPLIVDLWSTNHRNRSGRAGTTLCFEQPELHLHPRLQSRVGSVFAQAARLAADNDQPLTIIAETHSDALIGGVGRAVEDGVLSPDDVQVLLFEQVRETGETAVRRSLFDHDGHLLDWPFGFFLPD